MIERVFAIDQSLVNSGVAIWKDNQIELQSIKPKVREVERLVEIRSHLVELNKVVNPQVIVCENYAFAQHGASFSLGELGGMIRLFCYDNNIPLVIIPIQTHKMFSTGKGNTQKDMMLKEVYKNYGIDTADNNIADAVSLLKTFLAYCTWKIEDTELKPPQLKAVLKLDDILNSNNGVQRLIYKEE